MVVFLFVDSTAGSVLAMFMSTTTCNLLGLITLHILVTVCGLPQNTSDFLGSNTRSRRQSCGASFVCETGQCVDFTKVCDGKPDCEDFSDETRKTCTPWSRRCPEHSFQCSYGACIDGVKKCDGAVDCADESDERVFGCSTLETSSSTVRSFVKCKSIDFTCDTGHCIDKTLVCNGKMDCIDGSDERCEQNSPTDATPITSDICLMPPPPENGDFVVNGCPEDDSSPICRKVLGTPVTTTILLNYSCDPGYQIQGNSLSFCYRGKWLPVPECVPVTCPPLISNSVQVRCSLNNVLIPCEKPVPPGTEAHLKCKEAHQLLSEPGYRKIYCRADGQWNTFMFECTPVCGVRTPEGTPAISGGRDAEVGEFPWHVAIYKKNSNNVFTQICGGSLITNKLVVTTAHCFWDERTKKMVPKERFMFVAGKYNRDYYLVDPEAQYAEPEDLKVPPFFQGDRFSYRQDIAVITLNISLKFDLAVSPVCIDWDNKYERFSLIPGKLGLVAGWGVTEKQEPSTTIKTAQLPYIDDTTCWKTVPETFLNYVTEDKFCAGYTNGTSVCPGDSGGGLVFHYNNAWYLRGLVSVGVRKAGLKCFTEQYTVFTRVSTYLGFIEDYKKSRDSTNQIGSPSISS